MILKIIKESKGLKDSPDMEPSYEYKNLIVLQGTRFMKEPKFLA